MSKRLANVKVGKNDQGRVGFLVSVPGTLKTWVSKCATVYPDEEGLYSPRDVRRAIAAGAGAAAEALAEDYSDPIDPSQAAKDADDAFLELCSNIAKAQKMRT